MIFVNVSRVTCLETTNECKDFLTRILLHPSEHRLGYENDSKDIISHDFFCDVDVNTLYEGIGPIYPNLANNNLADNSISSYKKNIPVFNLLQTDEIHDVPILGDIETRVRNSLEKNVHKKSSGTGGSDEDLNDFEFFTYYP